MVRIKVRKIGDGLGVVLPVEVLRRLGVGEGDDLVLSESTDGLRLTPDDPDFVETMKIAEDIMHRYADVLRDLA